MVFKSTGLSYKLKLKLLYLKQNLLLFCVRSKEIEAAGLSGADPFKEVRIQSVVVEFLLSNVEVLFSDSFTSVGRFSAGMFTQQICSHLQVNHSFTHCFGLSGVFKQHFH